MRNKHRLRLSSPAAFGRKSVLLTAVWTAGLTTGFLVSTSASQSYLLLMRRAATAPVSIVWLLAGVLLPFLCVAFATYFSKTGLIYLVCFLKAFAFMAAAGCVSIAFGSAGWLVRWLVLFTEMTTLPLFYWLSLRSLWTKGKGLPVDFGVYGAVAVMTVYLDYCYVSPFLVMLIENY